MREGLWGQLMVALYRTDQQAEALRAFQAARRILGEELGIEPNTALRRIEEQILLHQLPFDPPQVEAAPAGNLPALASSFIGRVDEVGRVEKLVREGRLVTLTGLGGIGKTTLAMEVARRLTDTYSDGVWLITLATLSDPSLVVAEIAGTFDVPEQPSRPLAEAVVDDLSSKSLLMVVDNCEHLIGEVAQVVNSLLEGCPGLRILATSREPLRIPGEQTWVVPPLDLPDTEEGITVAEARDADAVSLFLERAQESMPSFELDNSNVDAVVAICRLLDGIPLALEIATPRLRLLSPKQLIDRLEDRFVLLTGGERTRPERQRTLRATLDWSYDLLSDVEQAFLSRLAVFDGGFTLEAAEAICAGEGIDPADVLDLVGRLVDASFVRVGEGEPARIGMLETVRQYALGLLANTGEEPLLRRRHAGFFESLVSQDPDFDSAEFAAMLDSHDAERANLRAAFNWALEAGESEIGLRLAASLGRLSFFHVRVEEGLTVVTLALTATEPTPSVERADTLTWFCMLNGYDQEQMRIQTRAAAMEIAHIGEVLGDQSIRADSLWILSVMAKDEGDLATSHQLLANQAAILKRLEDPLLTLTLVAMADLSTELGELDRATREADEVERLGVSLEQPQMLAHAADLRGRIAYYRGDLYQGERLLTYAVGELRRLRRFAPMEEVLFDLVGVTLAAGRLVAAKLWTTEYLDLAAKMGSALPLVRGHAAAALIALKGADLKGACQEAHAALDLALKCDIPGRSMGLVAVCAQTALALGDSEGCAVLLAGAERIREELGVHPPVSRVRELDHIRAEVRALLDRDTFRAAWGRGTSMSEDDLVNYAREVLPAGETQLG